MKKITFIIIVFVFISIPLVNSLILNIDMENLYGVETRKFETELKISNFLDGTIQNDFENFFSDSFDGYNFSVRMLNQIKYSVFSEAGDKVVCNDGSIIFKSYVDELLGTDKQYYCTDEYISNLGEQISRLSEIANDNGKSVVVIITPTKAEYFDNSIPIYYKNRKRYYLEKERGVHKLIQELDDRNIEYVLSSDLIRPSDELDTPVFYKGGIHWTRAFADCALNEISGILSKKGFSIGTLKINSYESRQLAKNESLNNEDDLWLLMNLIKKPIGRYEYPVEKFVQPNDGKKPRIFIQGGSFAFPLLEIMSQYNMVEDVNFLFYDMSLYDKNENHIDVTSLDNDLIRNKIQESDVILLEVNEQNVYNMGSGTYAYLSDFISSNMDKKLQVVGNDDVKYNNMGEEESANGVTWRWAFKGGAKISIPSTFSSDGVIVRYWVPYSAFKNSIPDLPSEIEIDIKLNGKIVQRNNCNKDEIFEIMIEQESLSDGYNDLEICCKYSFESDGHDYCLQVLSVERR